MPSWTETLKEIAKAGAEGPVDQVRRKYLRLLRQHTHRNVIAYYSGWLQHHDAPLLAIGDDDVNALMSMVNKLDCKAGLDLLLHTPGGSIAATEAVVNYLRAKFGNDIRCYVPQLAMSGGTLIACACKEIVMGKQSSLGPIDPQFGGMAAQGVLAEYQFAVEEIKKRPESAELWRGIFSQLPLTTLTECRLACDWSRELARKWLENGMFSNSDKAGEMAAKAVEFLGDHLGTKAHGRHINYEMAQECGLRVRMLEKDDKEQDLVLTIHHAYMETFNRCPGLGKIVENHLGTAVVAR